ncbi:toxin [Cyanobacterium aponinum UTEX 3221]|uniref:toxin n=1 Tax=Cyanobacterium aponinum TaxID=379064 RepID=UPI002B4BECB5|nr:toxin [Cyanobacterium aponinum]WRL39183.1 toxin [Cyanobacterium aponinum UTEX 3221]
MKNFNWNENKNNLLIKERNISFPDVVKAIKEGDLLDVIAHYNQEKYSQQCIFIIKLRDYVYLVPFVESEQEIFLKTIIPSRKMTKKYLRGNVNE